MPPGSSRRWGGLRSGRGSGRGSDDVVRTPAGRALFSLPCPRFCGLPVDLATTALDPAPLAPACVRACVHRTGHPPPRPPPVRELRPAPLYMCAWAVGGGRRPRILDRSGAALPLRGYMDGGGVRPHSVVSELVALRGCLRTGASSGASESARRIYAPTTAYYLPSNRIELIPTTWRLFQSSCCHMHRRPFTMVIVRVMVC